MEPPVLDIKEVLDDSTSHSPLIFILSPGVDPTAELMQLAESKGMAQRFMTLSLGQGQAPIATKLLYYIINLKIIKGVGGSEYSQNFIKIILFLTIILNFFR